MDIEKGKEQVKNELLYLRDDFSPIGLSLLDALCDIARKSGENKFEGVDVVDMANHIFNLYYDNKAKIVDKIYLDTYFTLDVDITPYECFLDFEGDRASQDYKVFRSIFVEAMLNELVLADVIRVYQVGKAQERREVAVVKDVITAPAFIGSTQYMFGLGLYDTKPYLDNFLHVYEITNSLFSANLVYDKLNTKAKFNIGLLVYVALIDTYADDKYQAIANILQLLVDHYDNTDTVQSKKLIAKMR